jgi:hypothetical protein
MTEHDSGRGTDQHMRAVRSHVLKRLRERYGVPYDQTVDTMKRHAFLIRQGEFRQLGVRNDGSRVYMIEEDALRTYYLAWSDEWHRIVTYLTREQALTNVGLGHLARQIREGSSSRTS